MNKNRKNLLRLQNVITLLCLIDSHTQKYSRLRCLLRVKGLVIYFYLGWSGSILQIRTNIIKVGSKSWLLTCSSNITLSLPSYTVSALYRELTFRNGYLSLLYFCLRYSHHDKYPARQKVLKTWFFELFMSKNSPILSTLMKFQVISLSEQIVHKHFNCIFYKEKSNGNFVVSMYSHSKSKKITLNNQFLCPCA